MKTEQKKQMIIELTSGMMHKHYCENDVESIIDLFDEQFFWIGAGEAEYAVGSETTADIFRQFGGMIPRCNITDEEYDVMEIEPEVYLCTGKMWIATDPSANMYLRVHQRITTIFRWAEGKARCCHIHISNPYTEMVESDMGFPAQIGKHSYEYLQECINEQKKQIEEQTAMLERMSFEDSQTGLFNRNKFNYILKNYENKNETPLGVACFDMNGLKAVNDNFGHRAGDELICRAARHILECFPERAFRIGGDEFVVIDEKMGESEFQTAISSACKSMEADGLSCSVGISWRSTGSDIWEQFEEADKRMYEGKKQFYSMRQNDRRKR